MMNSKKKKYYLKNIMPSGLPIWNNNTERFGSGAVASGEATESPSSDPFAQARSSLSSNDASLQSAKGLVNSIGGSLEQLKESLQYLLDAAGNASLMTPQLIQTLCEHAACNYRVLCTMANTLLITGMQQEKKQLDEQLYFDCFEINNHKKY